MRHPIEDYPTVLPAPRPKGARRRRRHKSRAMPEFLLINERTSRKLRPNKSRFERDMERWGEDAADFSSAHNASYFNLMSSNYRPRRVRERTHGYAAFVQ